jgi:pyrimidine operon attenuation protein/uracil phosphoribosyltransferase
MNIDVSALLDDMSGRLGQHLGERAHDDPLIIGVHTGGVWVAQHLHSRLAIAAPLGELNIAFYRDDFSHIGLHPTVQPSRLPFDVNDRHLVLVDDILYTGRTVRAAMNEIFDYGRPASITFVVLVDRDGRELPIQADIAGTRLSLQASEHVKLMGPEQLRLELCQAKTA